MFKLSHLKLQYQLWLTIILMTVLPIIIVTIYYTLTMTSTLQDEIRLNYQQVATIRSSEVDMLFNQAKEDVLFIAQSFELRRYINAPPERISSHQLSDIERLLTNFLVRSNLVYRRVCVLDAQGMERICVGKDDESQIIVLDALENRIDSDFFNGAMSLTGIQGDRIPIYVSDVMVNQPDANATTAALPVIHYATRLQTDEGVMSGVLALDLDFRVLIDLLAPGRDGETLYLVNANGDFLFYPHDTDNPYDQSRNLLRNHPQDAATILSSSQGLLFNPLDDTGNILFFTRIQPRTHSARWIAIYSQPRAIAFEPIRQAQLFIVGLSASLIVAVMFIAYFLSRRIVKPIVTLTRGVSGLERQQWDVPLPLVNRSDEVGQLTQAFGRMRERIQELVQSLRCNVAELEASQATLRASEERLRSVVETQTAYIVRTDIEGNYTYVNKRFIDEYGWVYPGDNVIGSPSLDSILSDDHDKILHMAQFCLENPNQPIQNTLRKRAKDGGVRHTIWEFIGLTDNTGLVQEIQCIGIDITELMESREQMQIQRVALQSAANAVIITDADGNIEWVNTAFTSLTGYTLQEAYRQKLGALLKSGEHDESFYRDLWQTVTSGAVWQGELTNRRKDGTLYTEEQTITPVINDKGEITHFIGVKQDITERKQAEQMRLAQERLKTNLEKEREINSLIQRAISSLSHDIRTPLSIISMAKDMLSNYFDRLDEAQRRAKLTTISEQLRYVVELLNDLSAATSSGLSYRKFEPTNFDIDALCHAALEQVRTVSDNPPRLTLVNEQGIGHIRADQTLITRILLNLLSNAVKYSQPDSDVHLLLEADGNDIIISVIDHGIGMSEQELNRVFEPFFRTKSVRHIEGTGLGLNIVKQCVERHHGTVQVQSAVGHGTTFKIILPDVFVPSAAV